MRPRIGGRNETIWLTIYADLMTNMMLVFLALYGLTVMGSDAVTKALQSMKLEDIHMLDEKEQVLFKDIAPILRHEFKTSPDIKVTEDVGAVRIEMGENVLFTSGKADPKVGAVVPVRTITNLLKTLPYTIVVEGHTDSIPLTRRAGMPYRDNWELSLARSMSIVSMMTDLGVDVDQIAAAAYGEYRPRVANDSVMGRRVNRRVEIAVFKHFPYHKKGAVQPQAPAPVPGVSNGNG